MPPKRQHDLSGSAPVKQATVTCACGYTCTAASAARVAVLCMQEGHGCMCADCTKVLTNASKGQAAQPRQGQLPNLEQQQQSSNSRAVTTEQQQQSSDNRAVTTEQ